MAGLNQWEKECVSCTGTTTESGVNIVSQFAYHHQGKIQATTEWVYSIDAKGNIKTDISVALAEHLPPMPRVGIEVLLPQQKENNIAWLGLGPFENYPDRLSAARFGYYQKPLDEMTTPYIFPTDSGLRCGTSKVEVNNMQVSGEFQFSVSPFSQAEIAQARHTNELTKQNNLYLFIDHKHMGVGGDDSWSLAFIVSICLPVSSIITSSSFPHTSNTRK